MKKDNRGITFVELVIVVAIMSILVGAASYGLGLINGKPAEECAQKIVFSLEQSRTKAMGKHLVTYRLYKDSATGLIMVEENVQVKSTDTAVPSITTLGSKDVTVKYTLKNGAVATEKELSTQELLLEFDRTTGGFKTTAGGDCVKITVSKAHTTVNITLIPPTGKVYIE